MAADSYKIILNSAESDVEIKKSHFLGELKNVRSEEEAKEFLEEVRKKHRDARHHCFAMRIGSPENVYERFSDDGEPQGTAGKPILALLQGAGLYDVCAVVTRYFGGTLLGTGGLVRAYSDSLKEALELSESAELTKGFRFCLTSDYSMSNRIKYLAGTMDLFTLSEDYSDVCSLTYILEKEKFESFTSKVREMSGGKVVPENIAELSFFIKNGKPSVYNETIM